MPPSDNRLKRNRWGSPVPRPSDQYIAFKHQVLAWELANRGAIYECIKDLKAPLGVHFDLNFTRDRLITLKGKTKSLDAANFLKALCDSIKNIIKIDDSEFWEVSVKKQVSTITSVTVKIYPL